MCLSKSKFRALWRVKTNIRRKKQKTCSDLNKKKEKGNANKKILNYSLNHCFCKICKEISKAHQHLTEAIENEIKAMVEGVEIRGEVNHLQRKLPKKIIKNSSNNCQFSNLYFKRLLLARGLSAQPVICYRWTSNLMRIRMTRMLASSKWPM